MTQSFLPPLPPYPTSRLRRNRRDAWSRKLVAENTLSAADLIWPVFVHDEAKRAPVETMPGAAGDVFSFISFQSRFLPFARGLIDTRAVVYFVSIAVVTLLVSFRQLESRKWK